MNLSFSQYTPDERAACLALFDANCPTFFLPNERADYEGFLDSNQPGYQVVVDGKDIVGAFGLIDEQVDASLCWILLDPASQGRGLGTIIMERIAAEAHDRDISTILIAASQSSAPFFARFGAIEVQTTPDGWGHGMHRIDMELRA